MTDWLSTPNGSFSDNAANALTTVDTHWHVVAEGQTFFESTADPDADGFLHLFAAPIVIASPSARSSDGRA